NVSPDGSQVITVGKTTAWICRKPWDTTPVWRPFSYGLGVLAGGYMGVIIKDVSRGWFAFCDDDRGGYFCEHGSPAVFRWCLANDSTGIPTTQNATQSIWESYLGSEHVNGGILFSGRFARG